MRRFLPLLFSALLLLLVGAWIGSALAQAPAPASIIRLPAIHTRVAVSSVPVVLESGDNALVDSERASSGLCTFLVYIDRDNGNLLHIVQDGGDHLIDVELPHDTVLALERISPSFIPPGEKHADGSLLIHDGLLTFYFTGRLPGDPQGKFRLQRLDMLEPACR